MPLNVATRLLPYVLLLFVGVAGWSMSSTLLLSVDVIGIVVVAVGTSVTAKSVSFEQERSDEGRRLI